MCGSVRNAIWPTSVSFRGNPQPLVRAFACCFFWCDACLAGFEGSRRAYLEKLAHLLNLSIDVVTSCYHYLPSLSIRCSVKPCDKNIKLTIQLTREMMRLADQGDADREDTGCGVLYGVLRDSAFKIKQLAEKEKGRHQAKGWWQENCSPSGSVHSQGSSDE